MPHTYVCSAPCYRSFPTTRALVAHRLNKQECRERWDDFLRNLIPNIDPSGDESSAPNSDDVPVVDEFTDSSDANSSESDEVPVSPPTSGPPAEPETLDLLEVTYKGAGTVIDKGPSPFMQWRQEQMVLGRNMYYPFAGRKEWAMARWIHKAGLPVAKIDQLLKLEYVCSLSFLKPNALLTTIRSSLAHHLLNRLQLYTIASNNCHTQVHDGRRNE
jgi:hypothetical protein